MMKAILLKMSEQRKLAEMATRVKVAHRVAQRFVAGETTADAVQAVRQLKAKGFSSTLDYLGENVTTRDEALVAAREYVRALDEIQRNQLQCNVSLKLTQFGLAIDENFTRENVRSVVTRAAELNNFVRIDMEGSDYTDPTLRVFRSLWSEYKNVGIVIQAYLFRSEQDIQELIKSGVRIRLCKGAYKEPPEISFKKKSDTDKNFVKLMKILLKSGIYHGIATHDPRMIEATKQYVRKENIGLDQFEFQMLYGVRRDLQEQLVHQGYGLRVYVPYGEAWYSYLMRRMAERPANLLFVLRNLVRG